MDQRTLAPGLFRSKLIPGAAVCYSLAALLGLPGVVLLFDQSYAELLTQDLLLSGISTGLMAWRLIHIAITLVSFFCSLSMALGLWITIRGNKIRGLGLMSRMAQFLLSCVNVTSLMALIYLIYRVIRYTAYCIPLNEGIYLFYATMLPESVMVVQAWFLWKKLREFLDCFGDSAASIVYTLSSGKLDSRPIPGFTATGFLILAIFGLILSIDQIFSVTIVESYVQDYYKLLTAAHPGQYLASLTLLCGAIANILMSLYLRYYNRTHERAVYYARKKKLT